jgi:hypothetical protein
MMLALEATKLSVREGLPVVDVVRALGAAYNELNPSNGNGTFAERYVAVNKALDRTVEAVDRSAVVAHSTPDTNGSVDLPTVKAGRPMVITIPVDKVLQRVRAAALTGMQSKYDLLCVAVEACPKDLDGLTVRTESILKYCNEQKIVSIKDNVALGGLLTSCLKSGTLKRVGHGMYQLTDLGHEVATVINK